MVFEGFFIYLEVYNVREYTREEKLAYYFWLDQMIFEQWSVYLDLKLDPDNQLNEEIQKENEKLCKLKLELIDFYQSILDKVGKDFTYSELDEWHRKKYGESPSFLRYYRDLSI